MLEFHIPQMTCGHCVKAVTEAVHEADPKAQVQVDLPNHKVQVQTSAARDAVVHRLAAAGYAPT